MSKRAANYARSVTPLRYVFVRNGERPRTEWLSSEWAWWFEPTVLTDGALEQVTGDYRLVGEGPSQYCVRLDHGPRCCEQCRQQGLAAGRQERGHV